METPSLLCRLYNPDNLSAHDPFLVQLQVPASESDVTETDYSHTYTKFDQRKVVWDTSNLEVYQTMAGRFLSDSEILFPHPEHIPLKCELISNLLVKAAELCMVTKDPSSGKLKRNKKKISPKLQQAWQKMRKSFKIWKSEGKFKDSNNELYIAFKQAKCIFQCI